MRLDASDALLASLLAKADNVLTATANAGLQLPYPSGQGVRMDNVLTLDGARGEGGGQILRTALSLSAITTRAFRLVNLRAGRRNPGLLPQHLSAVRAAAAVTDAVVSGDRLASIELRFSPQRPAKAGSYAIDVAETAERGSAGSVTLILQTLLVPLALVEGMSTLVLRGGTHVEWSPPFNDIANAYLPTLRHIGFQAEAELRQWGCSQDRTGLHRKFPANREINREFCGFRPLCGDFSV